MLTIANFKFKPLSVKLILSASFQLVRYQPGLSRHRISVDLFPLTHAPGILVSIMRSCEACGSVDRKLYRCLGCWFVVYCVSISMRHSASLLMLTPKQSKTCQTAHRGSHEEICHHEALMYRRASEAKRDLRWAFDGFWYYYDDLVSVHCIVCILPDFSQFARMAVYVIGALENPNAPIDRTVRVDIVYDPISRARRHRFQVGYCDIIFLSTSYDYTSLHYQVTAISLQPSFGPVADEDSDEDPEDLYAVQVTVGVVNRQGSERFRESYVYREVLQTEVALMHRLAGEHPDSQRAWKESRRAMLARTLYGLNHR